LTYWTKIQILADEETDLFRPDFVGALGASKAASALLVLFIPNNDRRDRSIDQRYWIKDTLNVLGTWFGGATPFPRGEWISRDNAQSDKFLFDNPFVIQRDKCEHLVEQRMPVLRDFLHPDGT
jgi:hypothetical protein